MGNHLPAMIRHCLTAERYIDLSLTGTGWRLVSAQEVMYLWRQVLYAFLVYVGNPSLRQVCAVTFSLDKVDSVGNTHGENW